MAQVLFHSVEMLAPPLAVVDEQLFSITEKENRFENRMCKIIVVLEGACRHDIYDGARRVRSQVLAAGDVFVLPFRCFQAYQALNANRPTRIHALRLAFDPAVIPPLPWGTRPAPSLPTGDPESSVADFVRHHLQTFRHFPGAIHGEIGTVIRELEREAEARLPGYRLRVHGLCVGLTTLVARLQSGLPGSDEPAPLFAPPQRAAYHLRQQAERYVYDHLHDDLPLAVVARHVGVSGEHLARTFKQATGQTLGEFIRQTRLERAKGLLVGTEYPIGKIAEQTGFTSLALFSRSFRAYTGVSPSAYRGRLWGGLR